ncbi:uncharacterized protein LOC107521536 [Rousettus aegyptiacus]|uniref:uncharacterized protein LOC107521536 n=1 Tax=Rousettus aegyptiacus TaxID=9407 RepID=UPI00168D75B2|nr:uncharacterized protein LOC107521536 [Rousettus aegyptiacus]
MECREAVSSGTGLGQGSSDPFALTDPSALTDNPQAMLTVVVEVEPGRRPGSPPFSGSEETCHPTLLLEGPNSIRLLQLGTLDSQEQCFTFDRVLGSDAAQEAEQELLAQVQSTLGSVGQGYSVALLLRGRETEEPRLVPQLLQVLFEEALPPRGSDSVLSTLSLVQLSPSGRTQDLLSPRAENLSVLDIAPLGLVVEEASEVEVSDSRAASELYLQATAGKGRTCSLLTVTMSHPGPEPPEGNGTQSVWRGALRILQLPGALDCPLLQVLSGKVDGAEVEGSLPWIVSWLLEGNNYSGLLLRLDPLGSNLSLLQAALLGAAGRRIQMKQVVKAWSQRLGSRMFKGVKAEAMGLPEPQQVINSAARHSSHLLGEAPGRTASLGPGSHQEHLLRDSEEQVPSCTLELEAVGGVKLQRYRAQLICLRLTLLQHQGEIWSFWEIKNLKVYWIPKGGTDATKTQQAPDVALQFFLAQARRQRLQEQQHIRIQEELKHLEQEEEEKEEEAGDQVKGLMAGEEERQRWHREQTVLRLQLEALRAERDTAEQDLTALYDLHVKATRAQTCHVLQVFQAWRGLWEEQTMITEHHHRSLLAGVLQDTIDLAAQNQELQAQNQQLQQGLH